MSRATSGGGIRSNKVRHSQGPKVEPRPRAINPGAVADLALAKGNHTTDKGDLPFKSRQLDVGRGYQTPVGPTKAVPGPGGGRTIHQRGSQGQHGPVAGQRPGPPRDILSEFGPDVPGRRRS